MSTLREAMPEPLEIIPEIVHEPVANARRQHQFFLAVAAAIAVLAWSLEVRSDERVAFRGFSQWPLPHSCYSRAIFGVPCPGCGLTRSFVYLARADWQSAWREHRLGWLLAGIVAIQFPYRTWAIVRGGRFGLSPKLTTAFAVALMILLILNWAFGFAPVVSGKGL